MKHLALDYHFVRENVQGQQLRVSHISTTDQLADALTKPVTPLNFRSLVRNKNRKGREEILVLH